MAWRLRVGSAMSWALSSVTSFPPLSLASASPLGTAILVALRWLQHLYTSHAHVSLSRGRKCPVSSHVSLFKETNPVQKCPRPTPYLSQVTNTTRLVLYQLSVRGTARP